jgi:thiol-disulfide isomerase/thioredoxin
VGGLSTVNAKGLLSLLALLAVACESDKKHEGEVTAERSQAVQAPASQAVATPVTASAAPAPAPKKPHRALCDGKLDPAGPAVPQKKPIGRKAADGVADLPAEPGFSGFTWVNFWAAWCVPCKEEIPRLLGWQSRLKGQGKNFKVTFVSLDDDERQLGAFLANQPPTGLKATYWLREGKERTDWLAGAGVDPDPDLPQHVLVDAKGKIRCRVRGAVDDSDFESLTSLLSKAGD